MDLKKKKIPKSLKVILHTNILDVIYSGVIPGII